MEHLILDYLDVFPQCYTEKYGFYVRERRVQAHCIHNFRVNITVLDRIDLNRLANQIEVKSEPPHFIVSFAQLYPSRDTKYYCNQTEEITIPYMDYDEIKCPLKSVEKSLNKAEAMLASQLWTFSAGFACLIVLNLY